MLELWDGKSENLPPAGEYFLIRTQGDQIYYWQPEENQLPVVYRYPQGTEDRLFSILARFKIELDDSRLFVQMITDLVNEEHPELIDLITITIFDEAEEEILDRLEDIHLAVDPPSFSPN